MKRHYALIFVSALSVFATSKVFADSAAPSMNDSSLKRHDISLKFDFRPGVVPILDYKAKASVGTKKDSVFGSGAAGKVELDYKGLFPYSSTRDNESVGFALSPNIKYEVQTGKVGGKNEIVKQDLTAGKISIVDYQYSNGSSEPLDEFKTLNEAEEKAAERKRESGGYTYKVVQTKHVCREARYDTNAQPANCKDGEEYTAYSLMKKPNATVSIEGLTGEFVAHEHKALGTSGYGAKLSVIKLNHQVGFKLNGLPMDFCLNLAGGGLVGQNKILGAKQPAMFHGEAGACLGMQIGQLGRLGYEIQLSGDGVNNGGFEEGGVKHSSWDDAKGSIHQTASYKKKLGSTEIGASYTHSIDTAHSGFSGENRTVTTDMVMVGIGN